MEGKRRKEASERGYPGNAALVQSVPGEELGLQAAVPAGACNCKTGSVSTVQAPNSTHAGCTGELRLPVLA